MTAHGFEIADILRTRSEEPDLSGMSPDGLANSIFTHTCDLPASSRRWVRRYVMELHRRAEIADRPACMRGRA